MAGKKDRVERDVFITTWEAATNVAEVAEKLNLKPTSVMARASKYRTDGIPLKTMQRGANKLDIAGAKELLAKLRGTTVECINQEVEARLAKQTKTENAAPTEEVVGEVASNA